jgi:4-amino-4-deoxy-L-arabinose transferase-like glycosyltransferase
MPSRAPAAGPARPKRRFPGAAVAVFTLAFALRIAGIRWGLPDATHFFSFHPDEFETAGRASRILNTGNWDPEFFNYGSLFLYVTTLLAWPLHALGVVKTVVGTHVLGRLVAAAAGAATAVVARSMARRIAGPSFAALAGLFVALAPGHVLHSSFATVDALATLLAALSIDRALAARGSGRRRAFALAGAAAGLAAGTKYAAGLALAAPLAAALLSADRAAARVRLARAGAAVAAAAVAFLVAVPYAAVTPEAFRRDVGFELIVHPREGHFDYFEGTGDGWTHHLTANLPYALGLPLLLLGVAGVLVLAARRRADDVVLLAFALPYFFGLGLSNVRFLRYTLPLVPVAAVAAAAVLERFRSADPPRLALPRVLGAVALGWAAMLAAIQIAGMLRPDPRTRAADWIRDRVPAGASIGLASIPWFATPPVTPWNGGERTRDRFAAQASPWRFAPCERWNLAALEHARPDAFVMSEFDWREARRLGSPDAAAFLEAMERDYVLAARFEAIGPGARRLFGRAFAPHDWLYPFAEVRVWRRRG